MNSSLQDLIEKEVLIRAPKERVYAAIAEEEQIVRWFPEGLEGKLKPGESPILDFGEYGKHKMYVVAADPFSYFAYRWVSGSALIPHGFMGDVLASPNTLVEFHLEDVPGGTRVRLVESGFASLPPERYEQNLRDNTGGWEFMLDRLEKYVHGS